MEGDAVAADQGDEIGGDEILRRAMDIGEVAAAAAGDEDFLPRGLGMVEHEDAPAPPARPHGAEQAGGTGAEHHDIEILHAVMCHSSGRGVSPPSTDGRH